MKHYAPNRIGKQYSTITLEDLEYKIPLGWTEAERDQPRSIFWKIQLDFPTPKAHLSDHLKDTFDYDIIVEAIDKIMDQKSFKLLEYMVYKLGDDLVSKIPAGSFLKIQVTKVYPKDPYLKAKVSYEESFET